MGLDISAYSKVKFVRQFSGWGDVDFDTQVVINDVANQPFDGVADDMKDGVYSFEDDMSFGAGSYSGYNYWRNELSLFALGVEAKDVRDDYMAYEGRPFARMINFSDCEGIIGTEWCKKLANDFVEYEEKAKEYFDESHTTYGYVYGRMLGFDKYQLWKDAFLLASDGGFVDFH